MSTTNEWDQLKKVVVGVADYAKIPDFDISMRLVNYAHIEDDEKIKEITGPYPKQVWDEANEDLEIFVNFLKDEGIEVVRPIREQNNYYNYCPRDSVFVYDDITLATPMPVRARYKEYKSFEVHLKNLRDMCFTQSDNLYNEKCINNPYELALTEAFPAFDAANVIRANEDVLYLVSNSGNRAGGLLLQSILLGRAKVHLLENIYSYMHIDSTIAFLREGLMLINPERVPHKELLPKPFCDWDAIVCPEPYDIGHYPGICNASKWINMNLFSINSELVVLEEHQHNLRKELEKYSIESVMLPMRHQRTLGGGFHCVTLDLERAS